MERRLLLEHGTRAFVLSPSSIIGAAEEDIRRRERNTDKDIAEIEHYAFHRAHVVKAHKGPNPPTAQTIIELALADIERGRHSSKHWTRVLYSDESILREALNVAGA